MNIPKAVVFDLGKVLLDFDYSKAARNMAAHCSLAEAELLGLLNQSALLHQYETGGLTTMEFFEEVRRKSSFCRALEHFEPLFADIFRPIPEMIALNEHLRKDGVATFIFSNTNDIAIRHIRQRYPFFANFDGYILSYEHRAMKPHPSIYKVVEDTAGARGADILYVDDRDENIAHGRERGWQVILHQSSDATIAEVHRRCNLT